MAKKLQDALLQQKELNEQVKLTLSGKLGIPLGGSRLVEVPNRNSFVYVQLRDNQNEVIQAFNNKVAPSYGLPVIVQREGNRYIVLGVDTQRYQNNWNSFAPYLPRHGNTHSRLEGSGGGGDVTWVTSNQFMPLLSIPSGSSGGPNVIISPHTIQNISGGWTYVGNTGTQSLLSYIPNGGNAVMVLVYLDRATGNPGIAVGSGSLFANTLTGTSQIVPYIPSIPDPLRQIPIGAVRLVTGTAYIGWDNIYDIRQFIQYIATGTSGGSGGLDTGTANALYLRLDASNDPVTGRVDITPASANVIPLVVTNFGNAIGIAANQNGSSSSSVNNPILYLYRSHIVGTGTFTAPAITVEQQRASGLISGKLLSFTSDTIEKVFINPSAQGTGTNMYLDGDFTLSPGGMLLHLANNGTSRFYVNASGTAYSNNEPLIKEAPITTGSYGRKNAGWELIRTPQSYYAHMLGQQIAATGTMFGTPSLDGLQASSFSILFTRPCTLKNFYFRNSSPNQPASGSLVLTVMKNLVATSLVITVAAGGTVQNYTDLVNTVSVVSGDFITVRLVNNATSSSTGCGTFSFDAEVIIGN